MSDNQSDPTTNAGTNLETSDTDLKVRNAGQDAPNVVEIG